MSFLNTLKTTIYFMISVLLLAIIFIIVAGSFSKYVNSVEASEVAKPDTDTVLNTMVSCGVKAQRGHLLELSTIDRAMAQVKIETLTIKFMIDAYEIPNRVIPEVYANLERELETMGLEGHNGYCINIVKGYTDDIERIDPRERKYIEALAAQLAFARIRMDLYEE